jgi:glyoxylase-like metal-dependent hydrolase (beta-lactamase superfamily II)
MERRRVGNVDVIALVDTLQTYPGTAIYPSAGEALKPFGAYMDANGGVELNFASFVLVDGDTTVLVDTGWGPEYQGRLPAELQAAGLKVTDIDIITYTHLHGDHTGWNFDRATGQPLFPTARYLVPKGDFEHYRAQQPRPDSFERDVAPLDALGRCELIEGETRLGPSLVTLPTPGHTPGHTSIVIQSAGERGMILGDVVISMIDAEVPSLDTAFDWDHALARKTREAIIARLASERSLVGASHLPSPGFGRFEAEGARSRWVRA